MKNRHLPPSLKNLDARLRRARSRRPAAGGTREQGGWVRMSGFGLAFRIGVELVSALIVGVGIGLLIDHWLGTGPWGLVVFFFLGAGAGVLNVYRAVAGYGLGVGYKEPDEDEGPRDREE